MASHGLIESSLFKCVLLLCISGYLCQRDCTGVECPVLDNCIDEVLKSGDCCATCLQTGCMCEGYQYYDCVNAGFRNGKVREGESYFVDFGSTECSCPVGGGRISCHFIPCPEIPANCIKFSEQADSCQQCERVGCVHNEQKFEAGHSFHMDPCQVCHCPNDGGNLMCYPIPDCDPSSIQKPMLAATTEESRPEKLPNSQYGFKQGGPEDHSSGPYHLKHDDSLLLFKPDESHVEDDEDYDYLPTEVASIPPRDLALPTESAVISVSHPETPVPEGSLEGETKQELRESFGTHVGETDLQESTDSPGVVDQSTPRLRESSTAKQDGDPESQTYQRAADSVTHYDNSEHQRPVTSKDITGTHFDEEGGPQPADREKEFGGEVNGRENSTDSGREEEEEERPLDLNTPEHNTMPTVRFSPTSQLPLKVRAEDGHSSRRQPQTLSTYQTEEEEGPNTLESLPKLSEDVSATDLVETCCRAGQSWASSNRPCDDMQFAVEDSHSICRTAQKQCCLGFQRESGCLAGITAAKGGAVCEEDDSGACSTDSYKECCSCCSLGLRFRAEGQGCQAHEYLSYPCGHVFLTCCEGEDGPSLPVLRNKQRPEATALPDKVSDSRFPNEAFSIGEAEETENSVEEGGDVDECQVRGDQLCDHRCVNTWGSYQCNCLQGYALQPDGRTCTPEDPVEDNRVSEEEEPITEPPLIAAPTTQTPIFHNPCQGNGSCMQRCSVLAGKALCSCFPGFSLMADGRSCEDVNECWSGMHNCSRGDFCVNQDGSFQCVRLNKLCDVGFVHNVNRECVDVNECVTNTHSCRANERCLNTVGSFVCEREVICPAGYRLRDGVCEDINECTLTTHNCGAGFECQNTDGSFLCSPRQRCFTGFTLDPHGNCIDIDECNSLDETCSAGFNCINTVGSYTCQRKIILCSQGYHSSPDGARCIDVDECQTGVHRCGEGQICHNLPGTYRCDCQTGYQYDMIRRVCVDVNECWRYPGRLCAQTCENTPGSYQCSCTAGFTLSIDGKNCEDVNECNNNPCSQECANIYGSYQCYCRQGFHLKEDGHTCEDIDECSQSVGHLCAFQCVNVLGSYQCACPPHGYSMSPNGRTCRDVDECAIGSHNCTSTDTCYNIQGGFRCLSFACPPNYRKVSDARCERVNCPNFLDCQNSPLRITYYQLSFQTNIIIPAQIFRIGPSPAYSGDNIIISIPRGNEENYFSTRKLNTFTGAVYLQRQVREPRDFLIDVEMKLLRQGTFTTFLARIYVFITAHSL